MFDLITKEVSNRFNLGDNALPLVQVLVAAMTNQETGGLPEFIERFKSKGLSYLTDSWLHSSAPLSINHAQIEEVLGGKDGLLEAITAKTGLDKGTTLMALAYLLPNLLNKLAPGGKVADTLNTDVANVAQQGTALLGGGAATLAAAANISAAPLATSNTSASQSGATATATLGDFFNGLIEEVSDHFNFGDKAQALVQTVVAAMTNNATGGLTGFIDHFKKQGLDDLLDSWFDGTEPLSINHAEIEDTLGEQGGLLQTIMSQIGLDKGSALMGLAYLLPKLFNKLAPGGNVAAASSPEISGFAEKGLALLGAGAAAASVAATANPAPVSAPIPTPAAVPTPVVAAAPTPAPEPVARPVVKPVPLAKTAATAAVAVESPDSKKSGGMWKNLLWLLPILLGLWLLKTCSKTPDDAATSTAVETAAPAKTPDAASMNTAPIAKPAATPAQATPPVTATPPAAVPAPAAKPAATPAQATPPVSATPPAPVAVPAPVSSTPPVEQRNVDQKKAEVAKATPATPAPAAQTPPTDTAASAPAAKQAPVATASVPSAKLYFQVGKINLPSDTKKKLSPILKYLKANSNAKVTLSGFHDPSGNQAINDKLAENRAKKVRAALQAAGIAAGIIVMEKPQSTAGSGSNTEARRVEVTVRP